MSKNDTAGSCEVCNIPTLQRCSGCKLVYYCNFDHQKYNWQVHKDKCRPIQISQSSEGKQFLKATRDVEPGDNILCEPPLILGPRIQKLKDGPFPCVGCCRIITKETYKKCPECSWPCCNIQCEGLKDHYRHGWECRILKLRLIQEDIPFFEYFRFDVLIVLRVLFMQNNKVKWEQFLKLQDHLDKRGPGTKIFEIIEDKIKFLNDNYLNTLKQYQEKSNKTILPDISNALIEKIFAVIELNSIELLDEFDGLVLYPTASLIEHNCIPNTTQIIDTKNNFKVTVKAVLPIKKSDNFTMIYTNILWGTQARRADLRKSKHITCDCDRCRDPSELGSFLSALRCLGIDETNPCGGVQLPVKPTEEKSKWMCNKCKMKLPNKEIIKFVDHLGREVDKVLSKQPTVRDLEDILEKLLNFLHPNHYHVYTIKYSLIKAYSKISQRDDDFLKKKIKMTEDLIGINRKIDPGNAILSLCLGVLLHGLFVDKFGLLIRNHTEENKEMFKGDVKDISDLIGENKRILQNELKTTQGLKLYQRACSNEKKFKEWLENNA